MQKLNNIKNGKKKFIIGVFGFLLLGILVVGTSYAVYQRETEVTFINAKVGDFRVNLSNITSTSTNNSVDLSYTASGYNASTTCTFGTVKGTYNIGATTVNNSKCTKTGLTQNTAYYYKVCTKNNLKQEVCKEGSINTKYNAPTLSNITATSTTNSIRLTYTVTGHAPDYLCKWGTSNGNYPNTAGMSLSECNITGLTQGVTYYYRVCVSNNGGQNCKTGSIATKLNPPTLSNITATSTYNSIDLSYTMSGTVSSRTCKYGTSNGNYSYTVSNPTNSKCSITGLAANTTFYYQVCGSNSGGQNCKTGSITTKNNGIPLSDKVKVGDYISMTPTATSYYIPTGHTGYGGGPKINPSELNLWRVIKIYSNNTVEVISVNVSSAYATFNGTIGWLNYVGALNEAAAQYTNEQYVLNTRHFGYKNQDQFCSGTITYLSPPDCSYNDRNEEDINLVKSVFGTLQATNPSGNQAEYFISSRSRSGSQNGKTFDITTVTNSGNIVTNEIYLAAALGKDESTPYRASLRPILTFKSSVRVISGSGSSSSPYVLGGS